MPRLTVKNLLSGYEEPVYPREDGGEINTGVKFVERTLSGSVTSRKKKILTSPLVTFLTSLSRMIAYTGTRCYGAFFLAYGLFTVAIRLAKVYFGVVSDAVSASTVIGAIFALAAIPLLLVDKPFCIALQDFAPTDYIFFEFFSIKRMHRQSNEKGLPALVTVILGLMLAGLGIFLSADRVLAVLLTVVVVYLSFVSPEFAFFSTIIVLPVLPTVGYGMAVLGCMIGAAFISFMRKVIFGKRVYSIEQYDVLIAAFMLCVLISGVFMKGLESFESSLWMILLALAYPLASNLIANRRLADCALGALLISSVFPGVMTVTEVARLLSAGGVAALADYSAAASFGSSGAYATYLIAVTVTSAYFIFSSRYRPVRVVSVVSLIASVACLAFTARLDALVALFAGAFAYLIMKNARKLSPLAALAAFVPLLMLLLPASVYDAVMGEVGSTYAHAELLSLWERSLAMLGDHLFTGVGMGSDSFLAEIMNYGWKAAENSSNLFIEIGCEAGVFALLIFVLLLAVRVFHRSIYKVYVTDSQVCSLSFASGVMLTALLAFGMTEYIWACDTVYYLFWCIFGIGSAALRISKREHDDRVMYYGDITTVETSVIDVKIT